MIVEEMKIGNVKVTIHDDYIVSDEKQLKAIQQQLERLAYNHMMNENGKTTKEN